MRKPEIVKTLNVVFCKVRFLSVPDEKVRIGEFRISCRGLRERTDQTVRRELERVVNSDKIRVLDLLSWRPGKLTYRIPENDFIRIMKNYKADQAEN